MMRILFSLILLSLVLGCGTDDFLSRGEFDPFSKVDDIFQGVGKPSRTDFENVVLPSLNNDCNMCHDNPAPDYETALTVIEIGSPLKSVLYKTAIGIGHRKAWSPDRPEAEALAKWILLEDLD